MRNHVIPVKFLGAPKRLKLYGFQIWHTCFQGQSGHNPLKFVEKGAWTKSRDPELYTWSRFALSRALSSLHHWRFDFRIASSVLCDVGKTPTFYDFYFRARLTAMICPSVLLTCHTSLLLYTRPRVVYRVQCTPLNSSCYIISICHCLYQSARVFIRESFDHLP